MSNVAATAARAAGSTIARIVPQYLYSEHTWTRWGAGVSLGAHADDVFAVLAQAPHQRGVVGITGDQDKHPDFGVGHQRFHRVHRPPGLGVPSRQL